MKDGKTIQKSECDAMNVNFKMFSTHTIKGDIHKFKYQGKLDFESGILDAGKYKLIITPQVNGNYKELWKYDIIIKQ